MYRPVAATGRVLTKALTSQRTPNFESRMLNRKRFQNAKQRRLARSWAVRTVFLVSLPFLLVCSAFAIPASEYHKHVQQAVTALDTLAQTDETESAATFGERDAETVQGVRNLLPATETVESEGANFSVDNTWLHEELDKYAANKTMSRYELLKRITERLKAVDERLAEMEDTDRAPGSKDERARKLAEILQRPEYVPKAKPSSALSRLRDRILEWLRSWLPKPKPMSPGNFSFISRIAQWVIMGLAIALLIFVLKMFLPKVIRNRGAGKKVKETARIVLGETLEPDQSARDLLSDAEALARRGELRAAIRRAYIALLVELGDRKIISLAQYKTNRDYLRAVREVEPLYGNVKQLTDSFERHWYGLVQANETDWQAFRAGYEQALR